MSSQRRGVRGRVSVTIGTLVLTLVLTLAALVAPQPALAQSFSFGSVRVEGNQRIETATILSYLGFSQGETVSAGQLNDAGQRIRDTGLFETVDIQVQGGTLVIAVAEFPTINQIGFEGNNRLRDDELAAVIRSEERRVYSPAQAERDVAAITAAYADSGRVNATVVPQIIERTDNRVDLVFEVFEGGLTEVERISFVGNRFFTDRRLRGVLETKQAGLLRAVVQRDTFVADRIDFDRQVLTDFYRSRGYVDFQVQNVDVSLTRERDAYLITFNIQEGQQFRIGAVSVVSEIAEIDDLVYQDVLRLRPGVVYSPVLIETDIARIERQALRDGVDFVRVEPRVTRNDRDLTLDIEYVITRGERIFVERIDIEGNNTTLDRVVRNQFDVVEGDPFNPRQIRQAAERIRALGFFTNADVNAREGSAPDQVVIDVNVDEGPTGSLSFGGNYSTDGGFALLIGFSQRNFLGRGQALNFDLSTSADNTLFSFDFREPQFLGRDVSFGLAADYRTTDNDNARYDTETVRFQPTLGFPVSENGRLAVYYEYDWTDITDAGAGVSQYIADDAALGGIGTNAIGYTYSYDTRRSGLNPTAGVLVRFGQEFGVGDASFIKTSATLTGQTLAFNEEVTLRATLEGGALVYDDGQSRITDRYFLGSRIMRGFEPGGIGPRDSVTDDALGGNLYAVARLEAEFPLPLPEEYGLSAGVFIDYGSLWDTGLSGGVPILYDDFTPRAVAGFSIFWTTPIGPLRFNFTEPLMSEEFDRPKSFDVTISTTF
ncbi:MAG: beta barrel protein insertion system outer membrane component BamA [Rhodobacteraceae bacterium HLUCCA08]|nr:MAG: beta barrel protein insertion system outer membrane component BamA [Rhodobacteraceae bacterium HLUCCA08]